MTNFDPNSLNPDPSERDPGLTEALDVVRQVGDDVIYRVETQGVRVAAIADELGPNLSNECRGRICPVLAELALSHHLTKYRVALNLDAKEDLDCTLELALATDATIKELFGSVMDKASEGRMSLDKADALLDFSFIEEQFGVGNEVILREKIASKEADIDAGMAAMEQIQQIYDGVCPETRTPLNAKGVSVTIRKLFKRTPRDGECFGPEDRPKEISGFKRVACTNPVAFEALHSAIDQGLVQLSEYMQHLDTRTQNPQAEQ